MRCQVYAWNIAPVRWPTKKKNRSMETKSMQAMRKEALMAQQVETGLVFREMLGLDDAIAYWRSANIPEAVIERLVHGTPGSRKVEQDDMPSRAELRDMPATSHVNLFYGSAGRRRDLVAAAVVQAAIAIHQELGRGPADRMLRREGLGDDVIDRVLSPHGNGRRQA